MLVSGFPEIKAALMSAAFFFALSAFLALSGCSTSYRVADLSDAQSEARALGFTAESIKAGKFQLALFSREPRMPSDALTIYIEGDGAAWPTPYHPPRDPTPRRPVALTLALADPGATVVYLGRPCQFLDAESLAQCDRAYWVERRFAPEVVAAYDDALDQLRRRYGARQLSLVGYSGGGVIAALLASHRSDIDTLVTVAAPLELESWITLHGATPLTGSLDPAHALPLRVGFRSVHFAGEHDTNVPVAIVADYAGQVGGVVVEVPGFDHECCWARDWPKLLGRLAEQGAH